MSSCKIEREGEEFVVEVSEDQKQTTVTDKQNTKVTIKPGSGNFDVRLPNGWGAWKFSIDQAVEYAVRLCFESRKQLTADQAYGEMMNYLKKCEDEKGKNS